MPEIVDVVLYRQTETPSATLGSELTTEIVSGGPFPARIYRQKDKRLNRPEDETGTASIETARILSFVDPAAPVLEDDIVRVPGCLHTGGAVLFARIQRIRRYATHAQCDVETGPGARVPDDIL